MIPHIRFAISFIGFLLLAHPSHAQATRDLGLGKYFPMEEMTSHPLDLALVQAMDSVYPGTLRESYCFARFEAAWDDELNRVYQFLMERREKQSQEDIRQAQRLWIKLRDAEFAMIPLRYKGRDGTMYMANQAFERMMFVRHRALELSGYLMNDHEED